MGKLVGIPDFIWMKMTDKQKEEYYKQQKKNNIIVGIIVGITLIVSFIPLLLWGLNGKKKILFFFEKHLTIFKNYCIL